MRHYTEHLTIQTKQPRELMKIAPGRQRFEPGFEILAEFVVADGDENRGVRVQRSDENHPFGQPAFLDRLLELRSDYKLGRKYESNASTLLQGLLLNTQAVIGLSEGRLELGPWQEVFYYEFDGQRPKRVMIKVIGD